MCDQEYKAGVVYLDNAATTRMAEEAEAAMQPYLVEKFGNASTTYGYGEEAQAAIAQAREAIAASLDARPSEIYFTSGGSEADNWAIKGVAEAYGKYGRHIITSRIEHHAVLNSCHYLEEQGYEVTYLDVDQNGMISMEELEHAVREDTILISVMFGNNEVGTIEPVMQIGRFARDHQILFHTDAVQAYAQIPISMQQYHIDLLSASAHKFHGPKGVGFLYVRDGVTMPSFIHGGSQERGKRAGTENVPGIVGMGKAVELAFYNMRRRIRREMMLRNYLIEKIMHEIKGVRLNGHPTNRLPGNVNVSFSGVDGASLLILLYEDGICASGGSACNTGEERVSYVIGALGVPDEYAPGTVRMTLSGETTREEIDRAVEALKQNLRKLRDEK
ncbi:cysteine desulfurase family protein [Roseburia hominis]|uniref:cysteine desulfurase family protein n=1 Tax=Roseburia hominis TaxID=301301 RepID=UPI0026F2307E|nr:IscS subfamily cysteine desulfurase [Roseburia hominis]MCI7522303.1 IscS subfamily cysteine desulfurase [Roseburia hominis]